MTRLLCTGDWHVGAGLDYGRTPADRLRDQRNVVNEIVELAIEHDVDALLIAGDVWHRRRPTPAELLAVYRPLLRLTTEDTDVLAICGNHDVEHPNLPIALDLVADFVDVIREPHVWHGPGVAVACLPWTPPSRLVAARGGGDRDLVNREAAGLLAAAARGLRAQIPAGQPAVLMTHFSISGAATPTGAVTDDFHEVVLDVDELASMGWSAVVAGHIHRPQALGHVLLPGYVGSPAPVDFGEAACEHGVVLVDLHHNGMTGTVTSTFLPIASRPFVTLDLTDPGEDWALGHAIAAAVGEPDALDGAVVRVRYRATEEEARRVDHSDIRKLLEFAGAHKVYAIQPEIVRGTRARVDGVDEDLAPLAAVDAWVTANDISTDASAALVETTVGYLEAVAA